MTVVTSLRLQTNHTLHDTYFFAEGSELNIDKSSEKEINSFVSSQSNFPSLLQQEIYIFQGLALNKFIAEDMSEKSNDIIRNLVQKSVIASKRDTLEFLGHPQPEQWYYAQPPRMPQQQQQASPQQFLLLQEPLPPWGQQQQPLPLGGSNYPDHGHSTYSRYSFSNLLYTCCNPIPP